MKKILTVLSFAALLSCNNEEGSSFTVSGTLKNSDARTVYLEESAAGASRPVILDSAELGKDGSFRLSAPSKEESLFLLRTNGGGYPFALLINDVKKVTVQADAASTVAPYTVSGSPASQGMIDFDKQLSRQAQDVSRLTSEIDSLSRLQPGDSAGKQSRDSVLALRFSAYETAAANMKTLATTTIEKSSSPMLSLYVLGSFQNMAQNFGMRGFTQPEFADLVGKASEKFPGHSALAELKKSTKSRKAPDFSLPDTTGNPVSLSSFKGKYVLVDFWASWCKPCREENPNVVAAYNQFRGKNFTILGVSLDQKKDAWLKAIADDGLTWSHVSDLKYWNSAAAALYNVTSIPYNFLLDPEGNIIAENVRGRDLFTTLGQVLK